MTIAYKCPTAGNGQAGVVELDLKLTGTGAGVTPTAESAADTDNRLVTGAVARSGAGLYTLQLTQWGRVFLGGRASFVAAASGYQMISCSCNTTTGVLTFRFATPAGVAADMAAADICNLVLRFKDSGAQ